MTYRDRLAGTDPMDEVRMDPWGTHIPILAACVTATNGPVIELGCGLYSTPLLHALCVQKGRRLVSMDLDGKWLSRFATVLRGPLHEFHHVQDWDRLPTGIWSVALVDQTPPSARAPSIRLIKGKCDLIVCHDSEHRLYGYEAALADFKNRVEWRRYAPWTTVVSDTMDLGFLGDLL